MGTYGRQAGIADHDVLNLRKNRVVAPRIPSAIRCCPDTSASSHSSRLQSRKASCWSGYDRLKASTQASGNSSPVRRGGTARRCATPCRRTCRRIPRRRSCWSGRNRSQSHAWKVSAHPPLGVSVTTRDCGATGPGPLPEKLVQLAGYAQINGVHLLAA